MEEAIQPRQSRIKKVTESSGGIWEACCREYPTEVASLIESFRQMPFDDRHEFVNRRNVVKELLGLTERDMEKIWNIQ